jgi:hypothetical protein
MLFFLLNANECGQQFASKHCSRKFKTKRKFFNLFAIHSLLSDQCTLFPSCFFSCKFCLSVKIAPVSKRGFGCGMLTSLCSMNGNYLIFLGSICDWNFVSRKEQLVFSSTIQVFNAVLKFFYNKKFFL